MLPRRPLGSTGLAVGVVGLGTVKLGRNQSLKYPRPFAIPDDRAAARLLDRAAELGVNLLDTAPAYGAAEERLGRLLAGRRERWLLCTKVGEEFEDGRSRFDFSPEGVRRSVERSLRRLATDRLDLVLVHSDGDDLAILALGTLDALADLKREGKVLAYGFSSKTVAGGLAAAERCDCMMVTWNHFHEEEVPVLDRCLALGRGVLIKKPLASGHAVAGPQIGATFGRILAHPGVSSLVVGTLDPRHLEAAVAAAGAALSGEEGP